MAATRVGCTDGRRAVDVMVRCNDCGLPFRFVGVPGLSGDGTQARLLIAPIEMEGPIAIEILEPIRWDGSLKGTIADPKGNA